MYPFWEMIQYTRPHGGIVIGKGGRYIKYLSQQMGCLITAKPAQPERKRFKPYFLIEGFNERSVFMATIRIQGLLMESMTKMEVKHLSEINDVGQQNQHLNLLISEKEETTKKTHTKLDQLAGAVYNIGQCLGDDEDSDEEDSDEEDGIKVSE